MKAKLCLPWITCGSVLILLNGILWNNVADRASEAHLKNFSRRGENSLFAVSNFTSVSSKTYNFDSNEKISRRYFPIPWSQFGSDYCPNRLS